MYLHKDLSHGRLSYLVSLIITNVITAAMASLGFSSIMKFVTPIVEILYPILIVYIIGNLLWKWWKFKTHRPVLLTINPETSDWEE